ncbi:MAG: hypothetical protein BAJALOKI3v1_120048 [Promethearchaeota archaeon]|jgi:chromosome segregation ATPase|nr:MAG: hypothetical protein BAJALOKI3v1_120048 [Candidatus Lokiarchaeota archaeon]
MSGNITDSKTAIKKILLLVDEIKGINSDSIPKLTDQPNKLLETVEAFEAEKTADLNTIESNSDEITSLKNKITQNKRDIVKLNEDIDDLNAKRQEYLDKIQQVQNKLTEVREEIKSKTNEYNSRSDRLKELEETIAELKIEQDKFDEKIAKLQSELEDTYLNRQAFVENYENRVEAMNLLIQKDYIQSDQIKLIKALQKDAALELKNILVAIDLREDKADKILKKMVQQNGPIEYNEEAGTVKLLEEVDFK